MVPLPLHFSFFFSNQLKLGWVCAMKQLASENKIDLVNFEQEMTILYQLPAHPNIVRCLYFYYYIFIILFLLFYYYICYYYFFIIFFFIIFVIIIFFFFFLLFYFYYICFNIFIFGFQISF